MSRLRDLARTVQMVMASEGTYMLLDVDHIEYVLRLAERETARAQKAWQDEQQAKHDAAAELEPHEAPIDFTAATVPRDQRETEIIENTNVPIVRVDEIETSTPAG